MRARLSLLPHPTHACLLAARQDPRPKRQEAEQHALFWRRRGRRRRQLGLGVRRAPVRPRDCGGELRGTRGAITMLRLLADPNPSPKPKPNSGADDPAAAVGRALSTHQGRARARGIFRLSADGGRSAPLGAAAAPWLASVGTPDRGCAAHPGHTQDTEVRGPMGGCGRWVAAERPRGPAKAADPAASTPTAHPRRRRLLGGRRDQEAAAPGALGRGGHRRVPRGERLLPRRAHQGLPSRPAR